MEYDIGTVAQRATLTPAERAVLVEQAEAMKVSLDVFIALCKDGTAGDAIMKFIPVVQSHEYVTNIINTKVARVIQDDHEKGREH